jgi:lipopolysaccharide export LptBFGC system permease protein LptF
VPRVILPLIVVGLLATGVCAALNYRAAPRAESIRKIALEQISRGRRAGEVEPIEGHLFRDRQTNRIWFARRFTPGGLQLDDVQVTQQEPEGWISKKWYALRAVYNPKTRVWTLNRGLIVEFNREGEVVATDEFRDSYRDVSSKEWSETPWRVSSARLEAQGLSIPELQEYLRINADFPAPQLAPYRATLADRWALPWTCLIVVFVATPLGIVHSRRGVLAGVASSIFIFFGMIVIRYLFLALGKGNRIDPWLAPWAPNFLFLFVGLVLLYFRTTHRELPKFGLGGKGG